MHLRPHPLEHESINVKLDSDDKALTNFTNLHMLNATGLSVYRNIHEDGLGEVIGEFENITSSYRVIVRGVGFEKQHSVSQLEKDEVKFPEFAAYLGGITTRQAHDTIFSEVPTLSRIVRVHTDKQYGVKLFGKFGDAFRPLSIIFDTATTKVLNDERVSITDSIASLSGIDSEKFIWSRRATPHLSLGKIDGNISKDKFIRLQRDIQMILPDNFLLKRAVLHYPKITHNLIKHGHKY